jgi:hypothetical protein
MGRYSYPSHGVSRSTHLRQLEHLGWFLSAFIDLYLAFYPGFVLWKLQLKTQKKIALTIALSLGCV